MSWTVRVSLSTFVSTRAIDCHVPSASRPSATGTEAEGARNAGSDVVRAMAGAAMPVDPAIVAREQPIERLHEVLLRSRPELHDDDPAGRVRHEHVEQPVARAGDEALALARQVEQPAAPPGVDRQLERLHSTAVAASSASRRR